MTGQVGFSRPATHPEIQRAYRLKGSHCEIGVRWDAAGSDDLVHVYFGWGAEGTLIPRWKAVGFASEYRVGEDGVVVRVK